MEEELASDTAPKRSYYLRVIGVFFCWINKVRAILRVITLKLSSSQKDKLPSFDDGSLEEGDILGNALQFADCSVRDAMVLKGSVYSVSVDISKGEFLKNYKDSGMYTRIPVYEGEPSNIIGFIHIKDVVLLKNTDKLKVIYREILFVPATMKVLAMLHTMKCRKTRIAVVIDEYNNIHGIVTLFDIMSLITGEVSDEHDDIHEEDDIKNISDGVFLCKASVSLDLLSETLGIEFISNDYVNYDSLGGLILDISGKIPSKGEEFFNENGIKFTIRSSDNRSLKEIEVNVNDFQEA